MGKRARSRGGAHDQKEDLSGSKGEIECWLGRGASFVSGNRLAWLEEWGSEGNVQHRVHRIELSVARALIFGR